MAVVKCAFKIERWNVILWFFQVLNQKGDWVDAPPLPGAILVNVADLLQHWSGKILKSTVPVSMLLELLK